MVRMPHLLTTVVDFTSETCLIVISIVNDDHRTSFSTQIDHGGQQVWHHHHLHPLSLGGPWVRNGASCDAQSGTRTAKPLQMDDTSVFSSMCLVLNVFDMSFFVLVLMQEPQPARRPEIPYSHLFHS